MDIESNSQDNLDHSLFIRSKIKNNSGYLPQCYETTQDFPDIPDFHFRIEDDKTIIELQQLYRNSKPDAFKLSTSQSAIFNQKMDEMAHQLDLAVQGKVRNVMPCQTHGYYSFNMEDYNHDLAMQQNSLTGEMKKLNINQQYVSSDSRECVVGQKKPIKAEKQIARLTQKMNKLDISQF